MVTHLSSLDSRFTCPHVNKKNNGIFSLSQHRSASMKITAWISLEPWLLCYLPLAEAGTTEAGCDLVQHSHKKANLKQGPASRLQLVTLDLSGLGPNFLALQWNKMKATVRRRTGKRGNLEESGHLQCLLLSHLYSRTLVWDNTLCLGMQSTQKRWFLVLMVISRRSSAQYNVYSRDPGLRAEMLMVGELPCTSILLYSLTSLCPHVTRTPLLWNERAWEADCSTAQLILVLVLLPLLSGACLAGKPPHEMRSRKQQCGIPKLSPAFLKNTCACHILHHLTQRAGRPAPSTALHQTDNSITYWTEMSEKPYLQLLFPMGWRIRLCFHSFDIKYHMQLAKQIMLK